MLKITVTCDVCGREVAERDVRRPRVTVSPDRLITEIGEIDGDVSALPAGVRDLCPSCQEQLVNRVFDALREEALSINPNCLDTETSDYDDGSLPELLSLKPLRYVG